jgi:hypothetical protein
MNIKEELDKLEKKYLKKRKKIIKHCNHNWIVTSQTSNKYDGSESYKCTICGTIKTVCF